MCVDKVLYKMDGYADEKLMQDKRFRMMTALQVKIRIVGDVETFTNASVHTHKGCWTSRYGLWQAGYQQDDKKW